MLAVHFSPLDVYLIAVGATQHVVVLADDVETLVSTVMCVVNQSVRLDLYLAQGDSSSPTVIPTVGVLI